MKDWDWSRIKNELLLQRRFLLVGIAVIVVCVGSLAFGAWPMIEKIQVSQAALVQEKTELAKMQQRAALVTNITEEDRQTFAIAGEALPLEKQPLALLQMLQSISGASNTSLTQYNLNPGVISTESGTQSQSGRRRSGAAAVTPARNLEITGEFAGSFESLITLVENIEAARPVWEIESLTVDPVKRKTGSASANFAYTARMTLRSYYYPLNAATLGSATAQALNKTQLAALSRIREMKSWIPQESVDGSGQAPRGEFQNTDLFGLDDPTAREER